MIKAGTSIKVPVVLLLATIFVFAPEAPACFDLTVRDAAFEEPREMHLLGVMAAAGDPAGEKIFLRLEQWLSESGQKLNIELHRVERSEQGHAKETGEEQDGFAQANHLASQEQPGPPKCE